MERNNKVITYIVVRIKDQVKVLFEDEFIHGNKFRTQNLMIECLERLYDRKDFDVELYFKEFNCNED